MKFPRVTSLAEGKSFADGMIGWFPQYAVELVRIGEQGGTLVHNIRVAAEALGQQSEALGTLVSALTYPLVVLMVTCGIIIYFNSKGGILEQFAQLKSPDKWIGSGRDLYALAVFLTNAWWILIIALIALIIGINIFLKTYIGPGRAVVDDIPVLNLYKRLTAAQFMQTLGVLVLNGVVFKQALGLIANQASVYLKFHIRLMERRLSKGEGNVADVLATGLIARSDIVRLRAIAAAKGFEHALVRQGKQANISGIKTLRKTAAISNVLLLFLSTALAGIIIMGLYSISQSLGS